MGLKSLQIRLCNVLTQSLGKSKISVYILKSAFENFFPTRDTSQMIISSKHYFVRKNELFENMITCQKTFLGRDNASQVQMLLRPLISLRLRDCDTACYSCVTCVMHI